MIEFFKGVFEEELEIFIEYHKLKLENEDDYIKFIHDNGNGDIELFSLFPSHSYEGLEIKLSFMIFYDDFVGELDYFIEDHIKPKFEESLEITSTRNGFRVSMDYLFEFPFDNDHHDLLLVFISNFMSIFYLVNGLLKYESGKMKAKIFLN